MSETMLLVASFAVTGVLLGAVVSRLETPPDAVGSPVMRYLDRLSGLFHGR